MLFNSWLFFFFAPTVFLLYYLARNHRTQNVILLVASYAFYAAWDVRFLLLLAGSSLIDFYVGIKLEGTEDKRKRKMLLGLSLIVNLGALGFFKYFNFFVENMEVLLHSMGLGITTQRLNIILPIGISFYTLQTLGYSIDVYYKKFKAERNLLDYSLFVSFFPQLVAGPIERAQHLIPQLSNKRTITKEKVYQGLWLLTMGFFKKIVIADNLAALAYPIFYSQDASGGMITLFAMYAMVLILYCDFAGYSDIARGLAKLLGVDLVVNFNLPLISRNPNEFWKRWHISLTRWLSDYMYHPFRHWLAKKKSNFEEASVYISLFGLFVVVGLWHGAQWSWIFWGAFNGVVSVGYRFMIKGVGLPQVNSKIADVILRIMYLHVTAFICLFIPAKTVGDVLTYIYSILFNMYIDIEAAELIFAFLFFGGMLALLEGWIRNADDPRTAPGWNKGLGALAVTVMILAMIILRPPAGQPFIYFQF
jgi:alginate O-acetyltransferase complex protein AlgI